MAVGIRTPGPIFHFVQVPGQTPAYFLGTSVTAPKPRRKKYEIPVMNDLGGRSARFQSIQDGVEWEVFTTLNRFDLQVCRTLLHLGSGAPVPLATTGPPLSPGFTFAPGSIGSDAARGTLVIGVQDFQLVLVNGYAGTTASGQPAAAGLDLATARGWYSCSLMGYDEDTEGERVLNVALAIECRNQFVPPTAALPTGRFFSTFEGSPTNLAAVS